MAKQQDNRGYFDSGNHLSADQCARKAKCETNSSIFDWVVTNYHAGVCSDDKKKVDNFMINNTNLRLVDGYGVDGCIIGDENKLKLIQELSHPREKIQLNRREFTAVPDLSRGVTIPGLEGQLQQGNDTSLTDRVCDKYAERDFARLMAPVNSCWYIPNNVSPMPMNSKDIMRSHDTVCEANKQNGYTQQQQGMRHPYGMARKL
jgi:hypothetical protein